MLFGEFNKKNPDTPVKVVGYTDDAGAVANGTAVKLDQVVAPAPAAPATPDHAPAK